MENTTQVPVPTNPEDVQTQVSANVSPDLSQFAPSPATAPATEAQVPAQDQANIAALQQKLNERQIEVYKYQQEATRLQEQLRALQTPQVQPQTNPYDPQTQQRDWWSWEKQDIARQAAQNATESSQKQLFGLVQQAYEQQWQAQHPGRDINQVKAFAQMRGIRDLYDADTLMNLNNQLNSTAQAAQRQVIQNIQTTQQQAVPLRGTTPSGSPVQLSFEKLAQEYAATNGKAFDGWPQPLQQAFNKELAVREALRVQGRG